MPRVGARFGLAYHGDRDGWPGFRRFFRNLGDDGESRDAARSDRSDEARLRHGDPLQHHRGPRPALSRLSSIRRRPGTHRPRRHTTQRDRDRRRLIPPLIAHRLDPGLGGRAIVGLGLFALLKPAGAPFGALLGTSCQRHVSGKLFPPWRPRRDRAARSGT